MSNCCVKKISSTSVLISGDGSTVEITIPDITLEAQTKYCLTLTQPCPLQGYHLPVTIVGNGAAIPLHKFGYGNTEFGEDLPKCRNKMPLYFNNACEFVDLRKCGCGCLCCL